MTKRGLASVGALSLLLLIASCATAPYTGPFEMAGLWSYTLTDTHGNTYDQGTIRFDGGELSGTWTQSNFYDIEYTGTWELEGLSVTVTGAEVWLGKATGRDSLEGTWRKDNGDSGTWSAKR